MRIEGFSFLRNAQKLYYPADASIRSALSMVDRFVVALGKGDSDDRTEEMIDSIGSGRIEKLHTEWDALRYPFNTVYAQQADLARDRCKGDWLLFLQGDEVLHEDDLPLIQEACRYYLDDGSVEGLLFRYLHFWGDHKHVHCAHNWYPREVRIVRNDSSIRSWGDAQSFRVFKDHQGRPEDYRKKKGTRLPRVVSTDARVFHYGGMRPPEIMARKKAASDARYHGVIPQNDAFDHGPLHYLDRFQGTHPAVMAPYVRSVDWQDRLQYDGRPDPDRPLHKHEKLRYRALGFLERRLMRGRPIAGSHNYRVVGRFHPSRADESP